MINEKAKVILAKVEAVEGTDIVPTAATDAILTRNFSSNPLEVDILERNLDLPTVGRSKSAATNARQTMSFEVELAGSGTANIAAKWTRLLQGCGMAAPSIIVGPPAKVEQKFGVAPFSSLSIYHFFESQRRRALGAKGTFSMNFAASAFPFASFDFTGLLPAATPFDTQAPGVPDFTAFKDPVEVNTANTTFTLDGFAAVLRSLEFSANVNIAARNLVGSNRINRGNHGVTGTVTIEAPTVAAKNYLDTLRTGAEIAINLVHGVVAGNIVQIDMTKVQLTGVSQSNEDDVLMYALEFGANVTTGSDDLLITTK